MRKSRSGKIQPIFIAFLIPLVVIMVAVVFLFVRKRVHMALPQFDPAAILRTENIEGNRYNLDAQIESQLAWDEGYGRLLAVRPLIGNNTSRVSVLVPESVGSDMRVGQRYHMTVIIKQQGLVWVESLDKY